jgi:hypothetical protein
MSTGWPQSQRDSRRPYADDREDEPRGGVALDRHPSGPLPVAFGPNHPSGPLPVGESRRRGLRRGRDADEPLNDADYDWIRYLGEAGSAQESFSSREESRGSRRTPGSAPRAGAPDRAARPGRSDPYAADSRRASGATHSREARRSRGEGTSRHLPARQARDRRDDGWPGDRSGWPEDSGWPSAGGRSEGWPAAPQHGAPAGPGPMQLRRAAPQPDLGWPSRPDEPSADTLQGRRSPGLASRSATLARPRPVLEPRSWTELPSPERGAAPEPDTEPGAAQKPAPKRGGLRGRKLAALKQSRGPESSRALADTQPRSLTDTRPRSLTDTPPPSLTDSRPRGVRSRARATTAIRPSGTAAPARGVPSAAPRTVPAAAARGVPSAATRAMPAAGPAAPAAPSRAVPAPSASRPGVAALKTAPPPAAPAVDRPRRAQAKAAALKAASQKTASPRLASVKAAPRPASQQAVGAKPGRHRVVRRSILLVGGASAAAAAAVFAADFMAPAGPTHSISTPERLLGYIQEPSLLTKSGAPNLRSEIVAKAGGETSHVVDAVYADRSGTTPDIFTFVGGNMSGSASSFISGLTAALPGSFTTNPGSMQGEVVCASSVAGRHVAECAWADNDTFGIIESPTLTAAQLGADLRAMRPLIERVVK